MKNEALYLEAERRLWGSFGITPLEHRVLLPHSGVHVRLQEVGEGPTILFVHGASNSGTSWAELVARLDGFRCLLLDRPGCGLSEALPAPFQDVGELSDFSDSLVVDVLDAMDLDSADLVATSYGGYAALRAAAVHPGRVRRIVIFGWTMGAGNPGLPMVMRLAATPLGRSMANIPVNERMVRSMFKSIGLKQALKTGRVSQEVIDCYVSLLRNTDTMRNELEIGRWTMSWKGLNDDVVLSRDFLARIRTPVYFLWGEEDPFGPPQAAHDFVAQIPNGELELLRDMGHAVWLDDPDHCATKVTGFLRST